MRLFAAILLPESVRRELARLSGGIPGARWSPEENYHLTLRFIGEVDSAFAEELAEALSHVDSEGFELAIQSLGSFGGARPRLVWAGIAGAEPLTALRRRVESALVRAGLPPEERKYAPHVTLARTAGARPGAVAAWLEDRGAFRLPAFPVEGFSLMSSRLGGEAPVYREEVRYPFGGEAFAP